MNIGGMQCRVVSIDWRLSVGMHCLQVVGKLYEYKFGSTFSISSNNFETEIIDIFQLIELTHSAELSGMFQTEIRISRVTRIIIADFVYTCMRSDQ